MLVVSKLDTEKIPDVLQTQLVKEGIFIMGRIQTQVQVSGDILNLVQQKIIRQQCRDILPSFLLDNCNNEAYKGAASPLQYLLGIEIFPQLRSPGCIFNLLKLVPTCAHHPVPLELPHCFNEFTVTFSVILKCFLAVDRLFMLQHSEADCMENQPERVSKSGFGTNMRLLPNS